MASPTIARTREELAAARGGSSVSFVPTMGALHDGHVQLLKHARPLGETLVASIFVNPTQFAPGEDFEDYPRTFDADLQRCAEAGADIVFAPAVPTMYPAGLVDTVTVDPGPLGTILEGASRPTHFRGVLTVVSKLFGLVRPDVAVFGEKDYQQLTLIRQMSRELALGVDVVGCPTVREADGLAMSSRNRYLTDTERQTAPVLSAALRAGVTAAPEGPEAVLAAAHSVVDDADIDLDYLVLTDPELGTAAPGREARLLVAARVGKPRLLDNIGLTLGGTPR
ncbi:MAG: pantoate--beta-alanine ligase [Aeromicrobium sp.]|nr:pantoate--beta-alanine ligase [Aeromicrobium sp.]MCW2789745.1 pantoate--beta-alanine ligase [Aeromicrobium sp.]